MKLSAKIAMAAAALGLPIAAYAATQAPAAVNHHEAEDEAPPANAPKPKISEAQARAIVGKLSRGKIVESDYEKENGAWRWSFDIREGTKTREIGIDAMTGKVVENGIEAHEGSETDSD